jgi:uncharacterized membrane protein YeaQ/YmgE (transglycosylase-associated protein family)
VAAARSATRAGHADRCGPYWDGPTNLRDMWIIWTILIGLLCGIVARLLTPGPTPGGFFVTIVIGIVGSVIATLVGQGLGWYSNGEHAGFLASVVGAVAFLLLLRAVAGRGARAR